MDRAARHPSMNEVLEFTAPGMHGQVVRRFAGPGLAAEVVRIGDPAAAIETINWGRNYLYTADLQTPEGALRVVVKQHRNLGFWLRTKRRLQGSKASRSWQVARELIAAGVRTPQPVMVVESNDPEGPSLFVAEHLSGASEVRHFFRRLNGDPEAESFPEVEELAFLRHLGALARRLHDGGIIYRDLSLGNVLARPSDSGLPDLYLVDFNRARTGRRPGVYRRSRDICRFPILEVAHREAFLEGYWGRVPSRWSPRWWIYTLSVRGYLSKHAVKNRLRGTKGRGRVAKGARHHAHIPAASAGAAARDKSVWDHLSDQPHQHAGKLEKIGIRLADSPQHLREIATVLASAPRIWRRYRELCRIPVQLPQRFSGVGVCLRPLPGREEELLSLVDELGVRQILLRLHPWQDEHDAEERLASALSERGSELVFALPQNRDLVRDPQRWRRSVAHLAERFHHFGTHFQVGQAVNRSKWGIWTRSEYVALYTGAAEELRRFAGVELLGPAVKSMSGVE